MKKILVCDDEKSILNMLNMYLSREGYSVQTAETAAEAMQNIEKDTPDLVILDVMLPDLDGFEVLKMIFQQYKLPVIMLTAKSDLVDKILGLEFGADDYITKPFDLRELGARVRALLRRMEEAGRFQDEAVACGDLEISFARMTVKKRGQLLNLTPKEFAILKLLIQARGAVISRETILDKVWGYDFYGDTRVVDIQVARLRKKIEDDPSRPQYIITVFGVGYKWG